MSRMPKTHCSNCGKSVWAWACTMAHAVIRQELASYILTRDRRPPTYA